MEHSLAEYKYEIIQKEQHLMLYYRYVDHGLAYKPFQWHPDYELLYCLSGTIEIIFEEGHVFLTSGDCYMIDTNTLHATKCSSDSSLIILALPVSFIQEQFHDIEKFYFDMHLGSTDPYYCDALAKLKECILEFKKIYDENDDHCYLLLNSVTLEILFLLNKYFKIYKPGKKNEKASSQKAKQAILSIIAYVYQNYQNPLSITDVALLFHYQPHYFCHFFKRYTGTTFLNFCNEVRMYYAHQEILQSHKTIQEIAISNGFSNYDSFRKLFVARFGMTPSQFRKNHKK